MTKKQLTEFLRTKWQIKIVGPAIYQPTYEDIADALIKEGFVKVDEPQEHWEIYDQKVNNTLCVCFSLEEAIKYRPRYSNYETKIYHCVEVEND